MKDKLDVIMGVYDEPIDVLKKTLSSLSKQDLIPDNVIICLDNPDNFDVKSYLQSSCQDYPYKIIAIFNDINIGLGYSLNKCLDLSTAKYIARMDADDTIRKDRLARQCEILDESKNGATVVFTGCSVVRDGKIIEPHLDIDDPAVEDTFFVKNPFKHGTLMMEGKVYRKYKYRISNAPEDYELYFRMLKDSVVFRYINEPMYYHHKFLKLEYRKDIDSFNRHSKMLNIYFKLLISNFSMLRKWKGYNKVLINTAVGCMVFSNYKFYRILKFLKVIFS